MHRVVFLVDMNAFFISCEMTRHPQLAGKPAAVAGDPHKRTGIILAANYDARKYGVKTAMVLHEAMKLCPEMLLVPPDHAFYAERSDEVMQLLSAYSPVIEQNSIDEAWLDMTGTESLFGSPLNCAHQIMNEISERLGLWCSIGIAENRFLSKMASEMKKPLGITTLWKEELRDKLWPLPVGFMYGIGGQTAAKLQSLGICTIGQLAQANLKILHEKFGKTGAHIQALANGIDDSPVTPHQEHEVKSIGRSTTMPQDIHDLEAAERVLLRLAEDVGMTARQHGKKGRTVQITLKYTDFKVITRQMTVSPTFLTKEIYASGIQLLRQNWNPQRPVRLLGIAVSGFDEANAGQQLSLFETMQMPGRHEKEERLEKAMDQIRQKYGRSKLQRAVLMEEASEEKT